MIKNTYETPTAELIIVRTEKNFLQSGSRNSASNGYDDDNDLGEI